MCTAFRSPAVALVLTCSLAALPRAQTPEQGPKPVARGAKAMASASHPAVTRAMLDVMKAGGNAVDAAITAVILQPILEPQMSTLAGGMSMLIYEAKTGKLHYLDAELDHTRKDAPLGTIMTGGGIAETSGRRIGVPGTVAGLRAAAERFGTKKWPEYFEPAIRLAEQGFPMYSFLYAEMADAAMGRISAQTSGREEFLPDGFVPPVGTTVTRPRLAKTLRRLASEGTPYFYTGEWAQHFVDAAVKNGGSISLDDMSSYEARWEEPLRSNYRGYEIVSSPPPATAGTLIAMILNILEPYDLTKMPHFADSSRTLALVRHAFGLAGFNSESFVRDPLSGDVPMTTLLSKDYAKMLSALIDKSWPSAEATPSAAAADEAAPVVGRSGHAANDPGYSDTNHFVVVDGHGNWVTLTHTVYGSTFATGLVVDGVGVNSGNGFPGASGSKGRRVVSPFPPTMVMKDGTPYIALGSPGLSSRAVALVLVNTLGFGMDLQRAIDAPRFQESRYPGPFVVENRVAENVRRELERTYGVNVQPTAPYNWHFGSIHAVMRDASGSGLVGYADPRRGGFAEGF